MAYELQNRLNSGHYGKDLLKTQDYILHKEKQQSNGVN